jgi:hypothetical protein
LKNSSSSSSSSSSSFNYYLFLRKMDREGNLLDAYMETVDQLAKRLRGKSVASNDPDDVEYVRFCDGSKTEIRESRSDTDAYVKLSLDVSCRTDFAPVVEDATQTDRAEFAPSAKEIAQTASAVPNVQEETLAAKLLRRAKRAVVYSGAAISMGVFFWAVSQPLLCARNGGADCFDTSELRELLDIAL